MIDRCTDPASSRRRHFWTTQPDACGQYRSGCGDDCSIPGLAFTFNGDCETCKCKCPGPAHDPECLAAYRAQQPTQPLSFATNDFVRSLLLNILNTDARLPATGCGMAPGTQGGHWSESYLEGGGYIGSSIRQSQSFANIREAIAMLSANVAKDAQKLVSYGVATAVDVATKYLGGNRVAVEITVTGPRIPQGVVNFETKLIENAWVWQ